MLFKSLYIHLRFYAILILFIGLFILAFIFPDLYYWVWGAVVLFSAVVLVDYSLLFALKKGISAQRKNPEKLSNGDTNSIHIYLKNHYNWTVSLQIIDEIPFQFQVRNFELKTTLAPQTDENIEYQLRPTERGEYSFGTLNIYATSMLGLLSKRYRFDGNQTVATYPSFLQMKKYDMLAFSKYKQPYGFRKIRKLGTTTEFEQIKEYVSGDDIRTINWKATAKKNQLMVNQYQDENAQTVYIIIDKGRVMKMPFDGLSLLDYAINASLALSQVILKKKDKVGLFTFSKKIENRVAAASKNMQMQQIMEQLYRVDTNYFESDYSQLYAEVKRNISHRSLLILFTNFETLDGLNRQLPYLRGLAKNHLLLVVFFENTELKVLTEQKAQHIQDVFDRVIAQKFDHEKRLIVNELRKYGIYTVLTAPENLSMDTINTYLEIKARGIL
ncbi:DUF58 domain-containing protein [Flavobacterium sp. HSC-61S13]|uniref:DUF58 domain-containing protein n=1 Tax=Flavobacterium sp. HSC-61S13 TaxID=2910963 RepID=UPI00209EC345|nr:DUF58 domain-containing protein [Flavobacterium sp. HSC-61S13]MCP1997232.1 uncharacterized protein (DUF58 family) [Flavobacterium sp. HSC-61S13]